MNGDRAPATAMQDVSRERFEQLCRHHGTLAQGYGPAYWQAYFAEPAATTRYCYWPSASALHTRLMLVSDHARGECRMFFITEDEEEGLFGDGS